MLHVEGKMSGWKSFRSLFLKNHHEDVGLWYKCQLMQVEIQQRNKLPSLPTIFTYETHLRRHLKRRRERQSPAGGLQTRMSRGGNKASTSYSKQIYLWCGHFTSCNTEMETQRCNKLSSLLSITSDILYINKVKAL